MKRLIFIFLAASSCLFAQLEASAGVNPNANSLIFSFDVANHKSNVKDKTRIDIFVEVPYTSIQFIKKDNSYNASYNVTLTFLDEDKKNILAEHLWKEKVETDEFNQTLIRSNIFLSYKTYDMNPGKYVLKCLVEDIDSRRSSTKEVPLDIRILNDTLDISDLTFISDIIKDSTSERIVPNASATVTNKDSTLSFFYEVYSDKDRQIFMQYAMDDLNTNVSFKQDDPQTIKAGTSLIKHTIKNINFSFEDYSLKIILKNNNWKELSSTEKKFHSKIVGVPLSITNLDKAIEQMIYIASPAEIDFIQEGENYKEKLNRFLAYWDKRKPNPKMADNPIMIEYYRRIEYANKNFKGFGAGWRSDMGMIYITFGPPSNVERHPMDANAKPYEIWEYYEQNRYFVFVDNTGFGDYHLYNPDYSRWPGYRQN
jgi:GWxTD domain-containing protein